jgi:anaerobic magnesium-protoporphyrin IX monomethyl ester cyclase
MRVVLLNPPVPGGKFTNRDLMGGMGIDDGFGVGLGPRFVAMLKNEGTRLPLLSLGYAAAILADHDVTVLDLGRQDPGSPGALESVVAAKPDWIVAASSFAFLGSELRFLERAREATGASRMLFGYSATHFAGDILERDLAEVIASGDPEIAAGHLARGTLAPGTDGVLMRGEARAGALPIVRTRGKGSAAPAREGFVEDLDTLPFPRWDGFPIDAYGYFPLLKKRPFLTLLSSRGCPYLCHFCPYPVAQGAPFRPRSAASVVAEMTRLSERHGIKSVLFRDPTFSFDGARVKAICRLLIDRRLDLEWGIETRLDRMDLEMIDLLGKAGCRSCEFGVDPLDAETLSANNRRPLAPDRAAAIISALEQSGVATAGLAVIGVPGQTAGEMERTMEWIQSLDLSYINYELATPFPGTALYAEAVEKGWAARITLQDLLEGDPKLGFNGIIDLAEMRKLQDRALYRFYVRPRKVAREIFNRDFLANVRFLGASGWKFLRSGQAFAS